MKGLLILTPVKASLETARDTFRAVEAGLPNVPCTYTVYDDFSSPENAKLLEEEASRGGFELVHLADLTDHPSPNYLLVLQTAQRLALEKDWGVCIVESDVTVTKETLQGLFDVAKANEDAGIVASVTTDETGQVNYPYLYAKNWEKAVTESKKHCSFCCSLLTPRLLKAFPFTSLDDTKNWYDVTISHASLDLGLKNLLCLTLPVLHRPHASRPWKQLKYKNPLKYYWLKFTKGLDKI